MKITFILPIVSMAGGIKVVAIYADALARMGHEVVLVSPPHPEIPLRRKLKSFLLGRGWPRLVSKPESHLDAYALDHRVLNCWRPVVNADVPDADVVIATWWETADWINQLAPSKGRKVYFVQGHEIFPNLPRERVDATYRMPFHKIVIANWLREVMAHDYGDPLADVVPNSVDRKQFFAAIRGKQDRPTVGFLYSGALAKGVDITLQAIAVLRQKFPNLRVLSFGSSQPHEFPHWDTSIEFECSPPQDRLRHIYAQCDAWLTASHSEGFNLTAMEAMSCRTVVVATRTGWPAEAIVDGQNGRLVDFSDPVGLADAAGWVLALSNDAWIETSQKAYQAATSGSWEQSAKLFEQALIRSVEV